ncbi:TlpA disulfide reductase family protein [Hymenobacter negativus]|uniref:AhpC/TSA family protein n=1 Tax=Hymenobacter negativus TaxID=2795026 RepID=A0ABS0Q483_9BACT|nr:TlpA disulfide reductase family protein [Hymenobacter negativus]MBH8557445.1 AhpC/TSA family protein [Hymenobacter negativus]
MKKHLLATLLALPSLAQAQTPFTCTVKGQLGKSITAPAKIYLSRGFEIIDSAAVKNGVFELKGKGEIPVIGDLILRRNGRLGRLDGPMGDRTRIYIEPGIVTITSPDSLAHAVAKGGPNTNDYVRQGVLLEPILARMRAVGNEERKLTEAQRQAPEFRAQQQARYQALNAEMVQANYAFIKANPNSYASLDALVGMRGWDTPQYATVGPLYESMSPALKATPQGRDYGRMVQALKDVGIGQPAPAISERTPDGKTVSLSDYRGKYVLVDFWASWCGPCRAESPAMAKVYNEYKSRNFAILGVSLDTERSRDKWVKAIADDQLAWTQVSELKGFDGAAAQRYGVRGIPQNFLIGPDGKIVSVNLHGAELGNTLAKLIK